MSQTEDGALFGALAKAQAAFPAIPRDRTVKVTMKSGGTYSFAYAPLDWLKFFGEEFQIIRILHSVGMFIGILVFLFVVEEL